jgi:hypothetical protein
MSIDLIPLGTARIQLAPPIEVGKTPKGTRMIVELASVDFEGDRVKGTMKGAAGADWLLVDDTGTGTLDVRYAIETGDGAVIYVSYQGRVDVSGGMGSSPVYAAPTFETGDERYAWLNKIQAVAKGAVTPDFVLTYEIYEVR